MNYDLGAYDRDQAARFHMPTDSERHWERRQPRSDPGPRKTPRITPPDEVLLNIAYTMDPRRCRWVRDVRLLAARLVALGEIDLIVNDNGVRVVKWAPSEVARIKVARAEAIPALTEVPDHVTR